MVEVTTALEGVWAAGAAVTLLAATLDLAQGVRKGELDEEYLWHWTVAVTLLAGSALWPLTIGWVLLVKARHRRGEKR